ncbi:MAG: hypothetical protein AB3N06_09240 [Erythrobacter sp.]
MVWTGLYEVKFSAKSPNYEPGLYGALVNVAVECGSEAEFKEAAAKALMADHFEILDVSDVAQISDPKAHYSSEVYELIREQFGDGCEVAFGFFHTYPVDGLDG